jgi:hypothetical protein
MKLITKIVMMVALFLMLSPSNVQTANGWLSMDEDPVSVVYSSDLTIGYNTSWTVTTATYFNGTAVEERDVIINEYLKDDVITAEIIGNMSEFDPFDLFFDDENYITFELNEEADNWDERFILPIEATWANDSTMDFIEVYHRVDQEFGDEYSSIKIEGGEIIMRGDMDEKIELFGIQFHVILHTEIRYEAATGVLNYYYVNGNFLDQVLEIVREGYDAPVQGTDDDAPFASIWFVAIGVLAIPVIVRMRRKD